MFKILFFHIPIYIFISNIITSCGIGYVERFPTSHKTNLSFYPTTLLVTRSETWSPAQSLNSARAGASAVLLNDGRVFISGGYYFNPGWQSLSSTEIYNPSADSWTTGPNLTSNTSYHSSLVLPNGKVLITGGRIGAAGPDTNITQLYDPELNTIIPSPNSSATRMSFPLLLLSNGLALTISGFSAGQVVELFNYQSNTWSNVTPVINAERYGHQGTILADGKVLVTGGYNGSVKNWAELYDPSKDTWENLSPMITPRFFHNSILLPNGKVLITNGAIDGSGTPTTATELFDPSTKTFSSGTPFNSAKNMNALITLNDGRILSSGGNNSGPLNTCEIFDPDTNTWTQTDTLGTSRNTHSIIKLLDGRILAIAGDNNGTVLSSSEIFTVFEKINHFTYSISGGTAPYTITALDSKLYIDRNGNFYPQDIGVTTIRIVDVNGSQKDIAINLTE